MAICGSEGRTDFALRWFVLREPFDIELDRELDGRWIAEIPELPGVMAYGKTRKDAVASVEALALRVLADQIERDNSASETIQFAIA